MTDQKICGYGLAEGGLCRDREEHPEDPEKPYCANHNSIQWLVCVGCSSTAIRECGQPVGLNAAGLRCIQPVCGVCVHGHRGVHARPEQLDDITGGAAHQPDAESTRLAARKQMIALVEEALADCVKSKMVTVAGPLTWVATAIVDDVTAKIAIGLFASMAGDLRP